MGWTNDASTEVIAPTNGNFAPGNNVIGMGTSIPPELAVYKPFGASGEPITAAIVFYNAAFNTVATTPLIKFHFIAPATNVSIGVAALCIGMGICNNPSVNSTAVVNAGFQVGAQDAFTGHMSMDYGFANHLDANVVEIGEYDTAGDGEVVTFDSTGNTDTGSLPAGH